MNGRSEGQTVPRPLLAWKHSMAAFDSQPLSRLDLIQGCLTATLTQREKNGDEAVLKTPSITISTTSRAEEAIDAGRILRRT
jgi:activator of HSP90 ATPase